MPKEGYFGLVLVLGTMILAIVQSMYPLISPTVGWLIVGILGILAVLLFIIGVRKKESQKSLILTLQAWAIGLSGMTGYPVEPRNEAWLRLNVSVNVIDKPIDTLDLIIDGKPIPANQWHGKIVTAFHVYFEVTEWHWKGKNQVELIAHVGGKPHSSGRVTIDFNAEPGGFPRYL